MRFSLTLHLFRVRPSQLRLIADLKQYHVTQNSEFNTDTRILYTFIKCVEKEKVADIEATRVIKGCRKDEKLTKDVEKMKIN